MIIDIKCSECQHKEVDWPVNSGETAFDFVHKCPKCGGTSLRLPNRMALRGCDQKGKEKLTYAIPPAKRRARMEAYGLADDLRGQALDTFDDGEAARLNAEADAIESNH